jgi:hypothetical protein
MAEPTQLPFEQLSSTVQMLPSLQVPDFGMPVQPWPVMQVSVVQSFPSLHTLGWPSQVEPVHESFTVHSSPSLQGPAWFVCWHTPFWQVSSVQPLPSSQLSQTPPFRPQFCGESTMQLGPEIHPVQQLPLLQMPPVHEAPFAVTHPPPLHMLHSPHTLQSLPTLPQRSSVCSEYFKQYSRSRQPSTQHSV